MRWVVPLGLCACLALSACQTTQQLSAERAKHAKGLGVQRKLSIGRLNPDVQVRRTAVVQDANGIAAVVELRNTGHRAQAALPLAIAVTDARGRALYRNDVAGLEDSLVSLPVLERGQDAFWVDNHVVAAGRPARVQARVGAARSGAPARVPSLRIAGARLGSDSDGVFARATIVNGSQVEQRRLAIFCVARRGARVVAAGRAIVDRLAPAGARPVRFTVFFIGNPRGARLSFSAPPTVLR